VTIPPWPGSNEAVEVDGKWKAKFWRCRVPLSFKTWKSKHLPP
jgi:hypothetical protein